MPFEFSAARHAASLIVAVSAVLSGCGGGGGDTSVSESTQDTSSRDATSAIDPPTSSIAVSQSNNVDADANATSQDQTVAQATVVADITNTAASVESANAPLSGGHTTTITTSLATSRSSVGVDLTSINSYSAQVPTIDLMKKAGPWRTLCKVGQQYCVGFTGAANPQGTLEESHLNLDASGWVKSLPADGDSTVKYRYVQTTLAEGGVQQAGAYTVLYDGEGVITYQGMAVKDTAQSSTGRDVVMVTKNAVGVVLNIMSTSPTNYIRNIRVYLPGGACKSDLTTYAPDASACNVASGGFVPFEKFPAATVWHPAFLASLKNFRTLRFMDWGRTNSTMATNWTDRTPAASRSWYTDAGVPLEAMFDLAAKTGADPWMNIPAHASDDYVHQFGKLAHSLLAPTAKLQLEYGNEMWNWSFAATRWAQAQSVALWPTQVTAVNQTVMQESFYAMRLVQVCNIVKGEFGADAGRVQCIANTQAANPNETDMVLNCLYAQPALGKPCYKSIDAVAIAPYVGYYIGTNAAMISTMSSWYASTDGGLAMLFKELTGNDSDGTPITAPLVAAGTKMPGGALAVAQSWMVAQKAEVTKYGLPLFVYEGGQGLVPAAGNTSMSNLMVAANRDPRMGAVYQTLLNSWKSIGGETFVFFSDVGNYGPGGMWGLKESQFDTTSPKWQAATQWRDNQACWWTGC